MSLRRTMAWIHGWLGLLAGWLLFAMFLTGTASYFRPEITRWMQPELAMRPVSATHAAAAAVSYLQRVGFDDPLWYVYLPDSRTNVTRVFALPASKPGAPRHDQDLVIDPATGHPVRARETLGGEHFYRFHFQLELPYPLGRWVAGACAMFMLGAIVSGVITHKRIFADLFTLRWNKGQRSWLDAHNVSAVLALPYHAMITYTGLLTLIAMYMPSPIATNYARLADFDREVYGTPAEIAPTGRRAPLVAIAPLADDAARRWKAPPATMIVQHPNDAAARVTFIRSTLGTLNAGAATLTYSGATGQLLGRTGGGTGAAASTAGTMLGLHVAHFAGQDLRWALFCLGLTGTAMVGTGLLLWTAARRRAGAVPFPGLWLVERLNIATIVGTPIGMAAYLLANRLIPAGAPGRADMEVQAMFWSWGVVAVAQCARPVRRAWTEGLACAATAFAAVPLANALTTHHGLPGSLIEGDFVFAGFDAAMIAVASLFALASWRSLSTGKPLLSKRVRQGADRA
ncbi:PepSY-associated TM helix domain-containing protein [Sphingomonas beigongshangi]|uniref:PepSY-associated TM helix domain-containing protein n=1 Tax=Sphingomonas beigongshangi TaxID=2782540 RepID=UPI001AED9377|nr:PepSY-associated TM helix domain-containing protein [Sphingomonas beigongshangi]